MYIMATMVQGYLGCCQLHCIGVATVEDFWHVVNVTTQYETFSIAYNSTVSIVIALEVQSFDTRAPICYPIAT
jgi:hypothetical protein